MKILNKKCPQSSDGLDFSHIISGLLGICILKLYYFWEMNFSFSPSKERKTINETGKVFDWAILGDVKQVYNHKIGSTIKNYFDVVFFAGIQEVTTFKQIVVND